MCPFTQAQGRLQATGAALEEQTLQDPGSGDCRGPGHYVPGASLHPVRQVLEGFRASLSATDMPRALLLCGSLSLPCSINGSMPVASALLQVMNRLHWECLLRAL